MRQAEFGADEAGTPEHDEQQGGETIHEKRGRKSSSQG
jgi:hypothetical protein